MWFEDSFRALRVPLKSFWKGSIGASKECRLGLRLNRAACLLLAEPGLKCRV